MGVFIGDAAVKGDTLINGPRFVPADWLSDSMAALRDAVGLPDTLTFQTKPQRAVALLQGMVARAVLHPRWLAAEARYGNAPAFRASVAALGLWYCTEVASDQVIGRRTPALIVPPWSGRGRKPTKQRLKTPSNAA